MTKEEAKAIIRKEYLCVDRDCDIERSCGKCDLMMPSKEPILQAYKMAMYALEQEPKTGHWIWQTEDIYQCSECGEDLHVKEVMNKPQYAWCPICGCPMEIER